MNSVERDVIKVCMDYYHHPNRKNIQFLTTDPKATDKYTLLCGVETPYKLLRMGLCVNLRNINDVTTTKLRDISFKAKSGEVSVIQVQFLFEKVELFLRDNVSNFKQYLHRLHYQQIYDKEIWSDKFTFNVESGLLKLSSYGKCTFKGNRALLIELVMQTKQDGISARLINKEFQKRMDKDISNREIDSMLFYINKRLKGKFDNIEVKLINCGDGINNKKIKISIITS